MTGVRPFHGSNLLLSLMIRGGYMPEVENMSFTKWLEKVKSKIETSLNQGPEVRQPGKSVVAKAWSKLKGLFGRKGA